MGILPVIDLFVGFLHPTNIEELKFYKSQTVGLSHIFVLAFMLLRKMNGELADVSECMLICYGMVDTETSEVEFFI